MYLVELKSLSNVNIPLRRPKNKDILKALSILTGFCSPTLPLNTRKELNETASKRLLNSWK